MKTKIRLMAAVGLFCAALIMSCQKDDDGNGANKNTLKNTSWTANDDIAELIYGKTCTTTIEFLDNNNCQTIDKRIGMQFGAGTFTKPGTYTIKADSVFWTEVDKNDITKMAAKISGNTLVSTMRTMAGGKRVYTKK